LRAGVPMPLRSTPVLSAPTTQHRPVNIVSLKSKTGRRILSLNHLQSTTTPHSKYTSLQSMVISKPNPPTHSFGPSSYYLGTKPTVIGQNTEHIAMAAKLPKSSILLVTSILMLLCGNLAAGKDFAAPDSCLVIGCKLTDSTIGCICFNDHITTKGFDWAMLVPPRLRTHGGDVLGTTATFLLSCVGTPYFCQLF
jgi:hypothetical protein